MMDRDLFQEFYEEHKKSVFAMVNLRISDVEDAKDVVQEIFMELWLKRDSLAEVRDIKPYLYVASRNHVISAFRRKNIQLKNETLLLEGLNTLDHSAEEGTMAKELYQQINDIVEKLPETTRQCYILSKNEGKRNGEIADLLNISEKTVRNNISEALKRLRITLKQTHPEMLALFLFMLK
ncbi:RNA polymerase ECF-type sigma factor [Pedobacter sp. BAL39]|uniref:RNA polymerase sigma factor n=1 Tax=Pedobacter sp. BAL39 TaxID=391596 RepID=UPI000155980A|nr:RNA polymerase sigma-70 factor [Pedobacter sp. BAL39]EDM36934.1 RNA polymerase ECF-type sigma factor [Pedobacter sp. BAL39]